MTSQPKHQERLGFLTDLNVVKLRGPQNSNPVTLVITDIERVAHTHTENEVEERILAALFEARRAAKEQVGRAETDLENAERKLTREKGKLTDIERDIEYLRKRLWPDE